MTKKGENIYKRKDGRWEGRYIKQRTEANKIIYGSIYGRTYTETKQKLIIIKARHLETTLPLNPYLGSFSEWITHWLTTSVRHEVKPTTYSNYYRLINKHIIPSLGHHILIKLSTKDLQQFIDELQRNALSSGSINNIFSIIKKCLTEAKGLNYITDNPCLYVRLPKYHKKEIQVLTLIQQQKLEKLSLQSKICSPIVLALYSGMRIGEISGLRWSDIDFETNLISINRTVSRIVNENSPEAKTKLIEDSPKSIYSERQIPLAKNLKSYLQEKQKESQSAYVVAKENKLVEPRTISNHFKKMLIEAGIPDTNFHVLRHTFATRCIEKGIDIASLSKILGHQSTKMTLDTYTGSLLETRRKAMSTLDKMLQ